MPRKFLQHTFFCLWSRNNLNHQDFKKSKPTLFPFYIFGNATPSNKTPPTPSAAQCIWHGGLTELPMQPQHCLHLWHQTSDMNNVSHPLSPAEQSSNPLNPKPTMPASHSKEKQPQKGGKPTRCVRWGIVSGTTHCNDNCKFSTMTRGLALHQGFTLEQVSQTLHPPNHHTVRNAVC